MIRLVHRALQIWPFKRVESASRSKQNKNEKRQKGGTLGRAVSLFLVLFVLWLLLSGHYDPLILGLGALSCAFVAWIAHRMDVVDHEGHPVHLTWRALIYWPWLFWQIILSNIATAKIIMAPRMPISPKVITVTTSQVDELGQAIYGNSITLTPGTVTLNVRGDKMEVHCLADSFAEDLETGEMDRRSTRMEGTSHAKKGAT